MSTKKTIFLICTACFAAFLGYRYVIYVPGYCSATQHLVSDAELIQSAMKIREAEIAHYGGIDEYEKHFIRLNRHPEEAGRDFDTKDTNCCQVYRGISAAKRNCGVDDYPLCVRLRFPPLKELPKGKEYYQREGRTYLFDDCGKLQEKY